MKQFSKNLNVHNKNKLLTTSTIKYFLKYNEIKNLLKYDIKKVWKMFLTFSNLINI